MTRNSFASEQGLFQSLVTRNTVEVKAHLESEHAGEVVGRYLDLLIGDQQIKRVIGRLPSPSASFCNDRARRAVTYLCRLLGAPHLA